MELIYKLVEGSMIKYILAFFTLIVVFSCSAKPPSESMSEREFWNIAANFDGTLSEKETALAVLKRMEELVITFDGPLAKKELILRNIQFLEIHSSLEKLDNYLQGNLSKISKGHNDCLRLYTNYLILQDLLKKQAAEQEVCKRDDSSWQSYHLALSLYLEPGEEAYRLVKDHCEARCNFGLLHIAMMEYFKSQQNMAALEQYAKRLLDSLLDNTLIINDFDMARFAMAYLSFALKMQSDKEAAAFFMNKSVEHISEASFIYNMLSRAGEDIKQPL